MRHTAKSLEKEVIFINTMLKKESQKISLASRYNYYAVENFKGSIVYNTGMTAKECFLFLEGMAQGLMLVTD